MGEQLITFEDINNRIITVRGERVLLDRDVAVLYDVQTKRINEAVKNNPDKFPPGYVISLKNSEFYGVRSKISTTDPGIEKTIVAPKAFTEKGLYMLATILKSPQATATTIAIVEAFAKLRELSRAMSEIAETPDKARQKSLMQRSSELMSDILGDDLKTTDTETSVELNFAVFKMKHVIKRK